MSQPRLRLQAEHWYGWQMLPGYGADRNVPYFSPILVHHVEPLKNGRRQLHIAFLNAGYADDVQEFTQRFTIVKHSTDYLIAEIQDPPDPPQDRVAIISHIEFAWIERCCPHIWSSWPLESSPSVAQHSVQHYLSFVLSGRTPD